MKKLSLIVGVFMLLGVMSFLEMPKADAASYRYIYIKYRGRYSYARLYINGRYYGRIYRHRRKRIYKRTGRWYTIRMKRFGKTYRRRIYLSYSTRRPYYVYFSRP